MINCGRLWFFHFCLMINFFVKLSLESCCSGVEVFFFILSKRRRCEQISSFSSLSASLAVSLNFSYCEIFHFCNTLALSVEEKYGKAKEKIKRLITISIFLVADLEIYLGDEVKMLRREKERKNQIFLTYLLSKKFCQVTRDIKNLMHTCTTIMIVVNKK